MGFDPRDPELTGALASLSDKLRAVVVLDTELNPGERSVAEIAEILQINRVTAHMRLKRAYARLRQILPDSYLEERQARLQQPGVWKRGQHEADGKSKRYEPEPPPGPAAQVDAGSRRLRARAQPRGNRRGTDAYHIPHAACQFSPTAAAPGCWGSSHYLVNGALVGVGSVYVGTHSVVITVIVIAAAVAVVLAVVAMAVKREDRLYSLSGAAPGAAARGARFLTRFGGAGSHFRPRGWM